MIKRFWAYGALFLFVAALPLLLPLFRGDAIGPFDHILQMSPWRDPKPASSWDVLQADSVLQFHVWRGLVFEAWRTGHMPFWNPYELCGTPLLANSQSAGLYPLHVLFGTTSIPTVQCVVFLAWIHLAWAGAGACWLSRRLGAPKPGAIATGILFALSPFLLSWTPLASVLTTCSWIPWVLGGTLGVVEQGIDSKFRIKRTLWLGVCIGMLLLAGHIQFAAYGLMGATLTAVVVLARLSTLKATLGSVACFFWALALGATFAAPQLAPVLNYSKFSHRQTAATEEGYSAYTASAIQPFELVGALYPKFLGQPGQVIEDDPNRLSAYWPQYVKRGADYPESAIALGPVAIGFLFLLLRKNWNRKATAVASVGATGMLLALGTPLNRLLYFCVPGWAATGSPGRAIVLFVLAGCVLAGLGWPEEMLDKRRKLSLAIVGGMTLLTVVALAAMMGSLQPWTEGIVELKRVIALRLQGEIIFALATLVLACGLIWKAGKGFTAVAIGAVIAAQFILGGSGLIPVSRAHLTEEKPDPNTRVAFVNQQWGLLVAAPALMPPNTAAALRQYEVGGYDSLLHRDTVAWLRKLNNGQDPAPPANGNMMFVKQSLNPEMLADAGVSEVRSTDLISQLSHPTTEGDGVYVYPVQTRGRAFTESGPAQITQDTADSQVVEAQGPGTLTVKDRNMPGWTATANGKPVSIREGFWREVELPSGNCIVRFKYEPPGFKLGLGLFAGLWLPSIIAGLLMARKLKLS